MNSKSITGFVCAIINVFMFTLSMSMDFGLLRFFSLPLAAICLVYGFYNLKER